MDEKKQITQDILFVLGQMNKNTTDFANGKNLILFGDDGLLDSLDLVTFLLSLEERIHERTGKKIVFLSDTSFLSKKSPFRDSSSLEKFILERLSTFESI